MLQRFLPWTKRSVLQASGYALVGKPRRGIPGYTRPTHDRPHSMAHDHEDFHRYTRGRFVQDEATAMASRYLPFNVDALMSAAASAVQSRECTTIEKCADGMYNKAFLLTMDDGKQVIAKLPNPNAGIPYYTTASEVATLEFMRTCAATPAPKVFAWCSRADETPVAAEYIIMEKAPGVPLKTMWPRMDVDIRFKLVKSLIRLQSAWIEAGFTGYGSIYFKNDLSPDNRVEFGNAGNFVLGPAVGREWFDNGRGAIALDRGPWSSLHAYLEALGKRELKCIAEIPTLPKSNTGIHGPGLYQPTRAKKTRAANLYLALLKALTPADQDLATSTVWHPDLHEENIYVDPSDPTVITSIIDWQTTEVSPLMFQARRPYILDYDGPQAEGMEEPDLPDNIDELPPAEEKAAMILYYGQALAVAYRRWVKAKYPAIWKALQYQETDNFNLLTLGRALLVEGEAVFVADIVGDIQAGTSSFGMTLADLSISKDSVAEIEADGQAALRSMEVMNEIEASLGPLFPEKGCVRLEHYDEAKVALQEAKLDVMDAFAKTDADRAAWEKSWPFDDLEMPQSRNASSTKYSETEGSGNRQHSAVTD